MNQNFKEMYIFNLYKDKCCNTYKEFKGYMIKKFRGLSDKFIYELYVDIVKYQIKTYGTNLLKDSNKQRKRII